MSEGLIDPGTVRGMRRVLFVCMGNICRSPLAQGVFEHLLSDRGVRADFTVESCGTGGWHAGEPPDPRAMAVAQTHGVELRSRARALDATRDFDRFDLILAMDRRNLSGLRHSGCPDGRAGLFLAFAPPEVALAHAHEVPDPYYGGPEGFDEVYRLVHAGAEGLVNAVL